jgi:tetratricopeptide (TPR) repeat protein
MSDSKSQNAFTFPVVDKSNLRYLLAVKDFNNRAVACRRQEDFKCAIQTYTDALRIDPESAVLYNNRGVLWLKKKAFDQAISDFSKAYNLLCRLLKSSSKNVAARHKKRLLAREGD